MLSEIKVVLFCCSLWEHTQKVYFWPVGVACGISVPLQGLNSATAVRVHQGIPEWQYNLPSCILKEIIWVFYSYQQYTYFPIFFFRYYNLKKSLPTDEQNFPYFYRFSCLFPHCQITNCHFLVKSVGVLSSSNSPTFQFSTPGLGVSHKCYLCEALH